MLRDKMDMEIKLDRAPQEVLARSRSVASTAGLVRDDFSRVKGVCVCKWPDVVDAV
jgi:hypothetical protein